ncbi:hypothetical protein [Aureimonas ureilytica]|uniref:hypothetical protein n=1 Tax=Aureimonas ureilytica TaxID=401562 RepID=UPI001FCD20CB|nr:hypothetical protein [Aureimonas ureilytica]
MINLQGQFNAKAAGGANAAPSFRSAQDAGMDQIRKADGVLGERDRIAALDARELEIEKRAKEIADEVEKAGGYIAAAGARLKARQELEQADQKALIDGNSKAATSSYVERTVKAESGGDRTAKNPNSSATGVGQFIESTWLDLFRRYYPERAASLGRDAILSLRTDADVSRRLIEAYAQENASVLQKAGLAVTESNLHLSHFLGVNDAKKVLQAAPGTPLAGLIRPEAIKNNASILGGGKTVDDVIAYADRRAADTRRAAGDLTPSEAALEAQAEKRKELKKTIDDMLGSVDEETKRIVLQTSLMSASTTEREKAMTIARLENELKREGIPITDELRAAILELANARGIAAASEEVAAQSLRDLEDAQQSAIDRMDDFRDGARDVLGSFISDLREGKSASEALGNALARIGDRLLESGIDSIIDDLFGARGTKGSGLLGSLFGGLFGGGSGAASVPGRANGGAVRGGSLYQVGERGPELFVPGRSGTIIPNHNLPSLQAPNLSGTSAGMPQVKLNVVNNTGVEADARVERQSDGSMSVVLDKAIAEKIGTRGTLSNSTLRSGFGARPALKRV